jgi:hypothetical protein
MLALVPYCIYQLPAGHPDKFRSLPDGITEVGLHDYDLVYKGEMRRQEGRSNDSDSAVLEELFYVFNMEHPKDFRGHRKEPQATFQRTETISHSSQGLGDEIRHVYAIGTMAGLLLHLQEQVQIGQVLDVQTTSITDDASFQ